MKETQTLEQLDKIGTKFCELINANVDKANTIVPETIQQYINYTICIDSALLFIVTVISVIIGIGIWKVKNSDALNDGVIVGFGVCGLFMLVMCWVALFIELLKAIIAPNILVVEKISQLVM